VWGYLPDADLCPDERHGGFVVNSNDRQGHGDLPVTHAVGGVEDNSGAIRISPLSARLFDQIGQVRAFNLG
jgi:hypothetical protein